MHAALLGIAPTAITLATLSLFPSEPPPRQGLRAEIEAVEKLESSVCGPSAGFYGTVDNPQYIRPHQRSIRCFVRLPP
jgi:hypothetical protein